MGVLYFLSFSSPIYQSAFVTVCANMCCNDAGKMHFSRFSVGTFKLLSSKQLRTCDS